MRRIIGYARQNVRRATTESTALSAVAGCFERDIPFADKITVGYDFVDKGVFDSRADVFIIRIVPVGFFGRNREYVVVKLIVVRRIYSDCANLTFIDYNVILEN